jgi:hypothetical protein
MILLSLNIRGVGGTLKSASLRRLLRRTRPDIIFLQETMVEEHKARALMLTLRPTWLTCAVSAVGTSGGLLVSWDPNIFDIVPYLCCGGILLTGMCLELNQPVTCLMYMALARRGKRSGKSWRPVAFLIAGIL